MYYKFIPCEVPYRCMAYLKYLWLAYTALTLHLVVLIPSLLVIFGKNGVFEIEKYPLFLKFTTLFLRYRYSSSEKSI